MATPNSFESLPTNLNDLQKYLDIATEYETVDLTVSYWCQYYAIKKGYTVYKGFEDQECLHPQLKEWLSKYKQELEPSKAITDPVSAQDHLESVALKHFNWADMGFKFFATNQFAKIVIETFNSTETLLDVCSLFWGINEELAEKKKLANLNAAVLKKRSEGTSEIEISANSSCVNREVTTPSSSENPILTNTQKDGQSSTEKSNGIKRYDRLFILNLRNRLASLKKPQELHNTLCFRDPVCTNRDEEVTSEVKQQASANSSCSVREVTTPSSSQHKKASLTLAVIEIMNGLTWSNIHEQRKKIEALLKINTEERLLEVSMLIYEKAVSDYPQKLPLFARMCYGFFKRSVPSASDPAKTINFAELLLAHCMTDFDQKISSSFDFVEKRKEIQNAKTKEKKKELETELEEYLISKRKSTRNIRFIGELFKLGNIVSPERLNFCIRRLSRQTESEESLEYLCILLTTVGKEIEYRVEMKITKAKSMLESMNKAFDVLESVLTKNEISNYIRFIIQKVIDLRNSSWINKKRVPYVPIQERHQAEEDSNNTEDGLCSLEGQTSNGEFQSECDKDTDATQDSQNNCNPIEDQTFSVSTREQQDAEEYVDDGDCVDKEELAMPVAIASTFFSHNEDHLGQDSLPLENPGFPVCSSSPQHQENSVTDPDPVMLQSATLIREMFQGALLGKSTVTKKDIEQKSFELLSTFFTDDQNIEGAVLEMKEWLHPTTVAGFIYQCLLLVNESSREERRATGSLIKEMVKRNLFNPSDVKEGYSKLLQTAEDWILIFPDLLWESAVELVEPLFEEGAINLKFLSELSSILKLSLSSDFVAAVLKELVNVKSVDGVERLWVMSNASLASVLPAGVDPKAFLTRHKELEFLSKSESVPKDSDVVCSAVPALPGLPRFESYTDFQHSLEHFLKNASELTDNEVYTWIQEQNFGEVNSAFIRALTTAIVESSIEEYDDSELNTIAFNRWTRTLLSRYVNKITDHELEVLFAVQNCLNKRHNLSGVVQTLLNNGVVSDASWELWFSMNIYFACE